MSTCYPLLLVLSALCAEIPSLCLESTLKRWNGQHENNTSSKWMNINCKDISDHPNQNVNLSYLSIGLVFCCFGQFENSLLNLIYISSHKLSRQTPPLQMANESWKWNDLLSFARCFTNHLLLNMSVFYENKVCISSPRCVDLDLRTAI